MVLVIGPLYLAVDLFGLLALAGGVILELDLPLDAQLLLILLPLLLGDLQPQIQLINNHHLHILPDPLAPQLVINLQHQPHLQLVIMPHELDVLGWREFLEIVLGEELEVDVADVVREVVVLFDQDAGAQFVVWALELGELLVLVLQVERFLDV